jgi:hypothetical protein
MRHQEQNERVLLLERASDRCCACAIGRYCILCYSYGFVELSPSHFM